MRPRTRKTTRNPARKTFAYRKNNGPVDSFRNRNHNHVELKTLDLALQNVSFAPVGGAPIFTLLNPVLPGNERYQRVGRQIFPKLIELRIAAVNVATAIQDQARVIVFYDRQVNATAVTMAMLLQDSNAAAGTTAFSNFNLTNVKRFKILRDHQILLPACTFAAGVLTNGPVIQDPIKSSLNMHWRIKLPDLPVEFNGTAGGTYADFTTGAFYVVFLTNIQSAQWDATFTSRFVFTD